MNRRRLEMMNEEEKTLVKRIKKQQMVIAMKGHPGSGKSTIARSLASTLCCPLIDKDDIRDSTHESLPHSSSFPSQVLNDLSYEVMFRIARTQVDLGLSVVIDSPLSNISRLNRLRRLVSLHPSSIYDNSSIKLVIIECKPQDEVEWRNRLENRGATAIADVGTTGVVVADNEDPGRNRRQWCCSSHKPATWEELERLIQGYDGCWDYEVGDVPKLVIDTTSTTNDSNYQQYGGDEINDSSTIVYSVLHFLSSLS